MRKLAALVCALALAMGMAPFARAAGSAGTAHVEFYDETTRAYEDTVRTDRVNITLNGEPLATDMPGIIQALNGDGRTMVPVRAIAEPLGATVLWVAETRQVLLFRGEDTIVLTLGSSRAVVNGTAEELPGGVPARLVRCGGAERTMVPLRFVSEQLHAAVTWDNATYTAQVETVSDTPAGGPGNGQGREDVGTLREISVDDNAQTITLWFDTAPAYELTDLGDRIVIDLPGVSPALGQEGGSLVPENAAAVRLRYARHDEGLSPGWAHTTRVVLDLAPGYTYGNGVRVTGDPNLQAIVITAENPGGAPAPVPSSRPQDPSAFTVVLDAGHGGSARGASYEDVDEKNLTLPITLRVAQLLEAEGCNVVLTREKDVYVDLYDRCDVANAAGADIFVSIHANASPTKPDFQGTFTYSYPGSEAGAALAKCIQSAVCKTAGSKDWGVLTNNYVVLRETHMPAALLETGFMSCHEELARLVDPAYQEKLAQGAARGILNYLATLPAKG